MPFKSQAQRRKFAELLVAGKISAQTFEEWNRETGDEEVARAGEAEGQAFCEGVKEEGDEKEVS